MKTYPGKVAMAWTGTDGPPSGPARVVWNTRGGSGGIGALKASGEIPERTRPLASCYQARSDTVTNNSAYLPQRRNLLRKGYAPTEPLLPAAGPFTNLLPFTVHRLVPPTSHRPILVQ